MIAILCAVVGVARWLQTECEACSADPKVLAEFRGYMPRLITASADGQRFVERKKVKGCASCETILVREASSGAVVAQLQTAEPALRVSLGPDGSSLAYFSQIPGTNVRRLFWWNFEKQWHREIDIPPSSAQPIIRWAPDGKLLAFITGKQELLVSSATGKGLTLTSGARSFDWRSDGRVIAVYLPGPEGRGGLVRLIEPIHGNVLNDFPAHPEGEPQELAWQGNRRLLLLYHLNPTGGNSRRYVLDALDPETGSRESLTTSTDNIREAAWIPRDKGFLWHQQDRAGVHRLKYQISPQSEARDINTKNAYHLRAISADGAKATVAEYTQSVHRLLSLSLTDGNTVMVAEQRGASHPNLLHETRFISSNGSSVPMLVSRVVGESRLDAAIIRIHAGTALSLAGDRWAEMQLYLQHGVHFIHIENRGAETSHDIKVACDFVHRDLGVPRERIVLLGGSSGGAMALDALMHYPKCAGILTLVGTTAPPNIISAAAALRHVKVLAFHGKKDPEIRPEDAQTVIETIFGPEALKLPRGRWHVFPEERHWLQRDESVATVHTIVLSQLHSTGSAMVPASEMQ